MKERIGRDLKEAMKARDEQRLSTLRLLTAAMKNEEIGLGHSLNEVEVMAVVKRQVKALKDALLSFRAGGRADLVSQTQRELAVLGVYLPEELSDEALASIVKEELESAGVTSKQDLGKVMGTVVQAVAGRADGNRVKEAVLAHLA
ncbi:MAG: hypothetical protein UY95_C0030G0003 [Parcubacteria group bacterium GW2011_GWA2_56_7]|nr:MAG: hypothetical protein UY95_C0030G0003 [Parcubacteria group bacterium GW2011_GWA2_56_7]